MIYVATRKVGGIYEEGQRKILMKEINIYDTITLQETHLASNGIQEIDNQILFKNESQSRRCRTGFIDTLIM